MVTDLNNSEYLDAANKSLGRLASEIAIILRGKNKPDYTPNIASNCQVIVKNASKIKITGKKVKQKIYFHYSGYPGGIKENKLGKLLEKDASQVLKSVVYKMLPKNKTRDKIIKNLKISN